MFALPSLAGTPCAGRLAMLTLHRAILPAEIVPARLYDPARLAQNPKQGVAELVRRGGLVGPDTGTGPAIASVTERTGALTLITGTDPRPAGNLLGLFFAPGTWSGILPLDASGRIELHLEGAFDYRASMALERALGGCRTMAESAMTQGTPVRASVSEIVTFLGLLLDDTARFVAEAATTDLARLRRLARPHTRLKALHLRDAHEIPAARPVDLAGILANDVAARWEPPAERAYSDPNR